MKKVKIEESKNNILKEGVFTATHLLLQNRRILLLPILCYMSHPINACGGMNRTDHENTLTRGIMCFDRSNLSAMRSICGRFYKGMIKSFAFRTADTAHTKKCKLAATNCISIRKSSTKLPQRHLFWLKTGQHFSKSITN